MKKSFAIFCRRNLGFARLAIVTNLEYRLNYLTDAVIQPCLATLIEITLWIAIFASAGTVQIAGFGRADYLAYVLWAAFIARITVSWMYEFRMIEEIEMGAVNSLLARPVSFFEYYLSQLLGYKAVTTLVSLAIPLACTWIFHLPVNYARLPLTLALVFYYLLIVHTMGFCIACLAFRLNKVSSFTMAKNLGLWLFSGELFPLDLLPHPWREAFIALPFSSAVYIPAAYLTGRAGPELMISGFRSTTIALLVLGLLAMVMWKRGLRRYSGTGA